MGGAGINVNKNKIRKNLKGVARGAGPRAQSGLRVLRAFAISMRPTGERALPAKTVCAIEAVLLREGHGVLLGHTAFPVHCTARGLGGVVTGL